MRDNKQKENSHHLFCSCGIDFFRYEQSHDTSLQRRPSVGRQASENSGSGIASRVCVGPAARRGVSKNSTIDMSQQKKEINN